MKPEEQRVAIWRHVTGASDKQGKSALVLTEIERIACGVPDYINDLNAMHEVEKGGVNWADYIENLKRVVGECDHPKAEPAFNEKLSVWNMIHATATQRAEAFLRTIGKWKEAQ